MDFHDVARGYGDLEVALGRIEARVLAVGIDTDQLYAASDLEETVNLLCRLGKDARYAELESEYGHDAFLVEQEELGGIVSEFLAAGERRLRCG